MGLSLSGHRVSPALPKTQNMPEVGIPRRVDHPDAAEYRSIGRMTGCANYGATGQSTS
jgi:hypothetical protein